MKTRSTKTLFALSLGSPKAKRLPESDFVVAPGTLSAVKRATQLSAEVESAIVARSLQGSRQ